MFSIQTSTLKYDEDGACLKYVLCHDVKIQCLSNQVLVSCVVFLRI